ncbi:MAG: hypothetical protein WCI73_20725, partial [Phycisphaerae bacterium]
VTSTNGLKLAAAYPATLTAGSAAVISPTASGTSALGNIGTTPALAVSNLTSENGASLGLTGLATPYAGDSSRSAAMRAAVLPVKRPTLWTLRAVTAASNLAGPNTLLYLKAPAPAPAYHVFRWQLFDIQDAQVGWHLPATM